MKAKVVVAFWSFGAGVCLMSIVWLLTWGSFKEIEQNYGRQLGYWDGASDVINAIELGAFRADEGENPRVVFNVKEKSLMKVTVNGVDTLRVR